MSDQTAASIGAAPVPVMLDNVSRNPGVRQLQEKLETLPDGQQIEARVLRASGQNYSLSFDQQTVELRLPEGFKVGEALKFEIRKTESGTGLELLSKPELVNDQAQVSSQREQLARALGLTQSNIAELSKVFREFSASLSAGASVENSGSILELLSGAIENGRASSALLPQITGNTGITSAEQILKIMQVSQSEDQSSLRNKILNLIEQQLSSELSAPLKEMVTRIKTEFQDLFPGNTTYSMDSPAQLLDDIKVRTRDLASTSTPDIQNQVAKLLNSIEEGLNRGGLEGLRQASSSLDAIVKMFEADRPATERLNSAQQSSLKVLSKIAASLEFEGVRIAFRDLQYGNSGQGAAQRLVDLLAEQAPVPKIGLADLKSLVSQQLQSMHTYEARIREVLNNTPEIEAHSLLQKSLHEIERRLPEQLTPLDRKFLSFVQDLREHLKGYSAEDFRSESGQALLTKALQTLRQEFLLQDQTAAPILQELQYTPSQALSADFQAAARKLHAQLQLVMKQESAQSPEIKFKALAETLDELLKLSSAINNAADQKLVNFVSSLKQLLLSASTPQSERELEKSLGQRYQQFLSQFSLNTELKNERMSADTLQSVAKLEVLMRSLLQQRRESSAPEGAAQESIKIVLEKLLTQFKDQASSSISLKEQVAQIMQAGVEQKQRPAPQDFEERLLKPLVEIKKALQEFAAAKIGQDSLISKIAEFQSKVFDYLKHSSLEQRAQDGAILRQLGFPDVQSVLLDTERLLSTFGRSGAVERLEMQTLLAGSKSRQIISLLKQALEIPTKDTESSADHQMKTQLRELLDGLNRLGDEAQRGSQVSQSKEQLQRQLAGFFAKYEGSDSRGSSMKSSPAVTEALRTVENMLKGQEMLRQLNPIMQAVGEPALLLFPSLLPGMVSQLEVMLYPPHTEERNSAGGRKNSKQQRVDLQLSLPALGKVQVQILRSSDQLDLKFYFEDRQRVEFARQFQPLLRRALSKRGFQSVQISSQAGRAQISRPEWFEVLSDPDSIIA